MDRRARGSFSVVFVPAWLLCCGLVAPAAAIEITVRGRVLDDGGKPLRGATVALGAIQTHYEATSAAWRGEPEPEPIARMTTDDQGAFALRAPHSGFWKVSVAARGFVAAEYALEPLTDEATLADLTMLRDARVAIDLAAREAEAGAPVSHWWIEARSTEERDPYSRNGGWLVRRRVARVDRAASGVVLPRVEGERLEIVAWMPGASVERVESSTSRVRLALDRGSPPALPTRVSEEDGTPVPNAWVCDAEHRVPIGSTDAAGRTRLPAVSPGAGAKERSEVLVLSADGRVSRVELRSREIGDDSGPTLVATLPRGRSLSGTVLDDKESKPLQGAWLWAEVVLGFSMRERLTGLRGDVASIARTGPAGAFELRAPQQSVVMAIAPGHFADNLVQPAGPFGFHPPEPPPGPRVVRLKPWRWIGGIVVDAAGQSVAGALVVPFAGPGQATQTRRSLTDSRGSFRLSGLGASGASKIVVLAAGYAPAVESVDLIAASRDDVRVVLHRGNVVRGRVTDLDDQVVAEALIRFTETGEKQFRFAMPGRSISSSPPLLTASRGDGTFEIAGVKSGFYDIAVDAKGYAITVVPGFEIPAGEAVVDLGPIRVGPGVVIEGVVLEGKGGDGAEDSDADAGSGGETPLAGATIRIMREPSFARIETPPGPEPWSAWLRETPRWEPPTLTSDAGGLFALRDVNPSEKVDFRASLDGYIPALAPGVRGPTEEPVRLVLERGGTIEGRVVDTNGEPIRDARVTAREVSSSLQQTAGGDADGKFSFLGLAPGGWTLEPQANGYERVDDVPITIAVEAGKVESDVRLVLREQELAEVDGRVVDQDGTGVPDASVRVENLAGGGARAGAGGEFHLERVPLGRRQIVAQVARRVATKTIEVREGSNTVEITLEDGVEVSGRVTDREGSPVAGARVSLQDDSGFRMAGTTAVMRVGGANATTDASGAFRLEHVSDGAYDLSAVLEGKGRARLPGKLEIRGAPVAGIELVMEKGAVIRGALLGLDIDQLSQVTITGFCHVGGGMGRVIGEEYEIANLEAGWCRVIGDVEVHGLHAEGRVEVAAGEEARLDLDFEGGFTLSGMVTRRRQPAPGTRIVLQGIDTATTRGGAADFEGRFALRGVTEGTYELTAMTHRGSGAPWVRRIEVRADTEVEIELGGGSISGLVLDAESGDPLPGADVRLRLEGPDTSGFRGAARRVSGASGEFAYEDVPEGSFSIEAVKEGYGSDSARLDVRADSETEAVVLELLPSEGLRLRVAGVQGLVPFIQVMAFTRNGVPVSAPQGLRPGKTGDVFEVPGIGAGSWSVLIGSGGHGSVWLDVEVPGPVRDVALPPAARMTIEIPELLGTPALTLVEVFDAAGRPFPMMAGDRYSMVWRIESGRGFIESLPPGQWTLRGAGAEGKSWSGVAVTGPGATAPARLE